MIHQNELGEPGTSRFGRFKAAAARRQAGRSASATRRSLATPRADPAERTDALLSGFDCVADLIEKPILPIPGPRGQKFRRRI